MAKSALARSTQVVHRKPVTSSPTYLKLADKVGRLQKKSTEATRDLALPFVGIAGAALPAVITRFSGRPLPTVMNVDPELLGGAAIMALSFLAKGKTRQTIFALGAGCAGPAVNRSIKSGTVKVGEDETGADNSI